MNDDPIQEKTQRLDIQYTCFSDCYTDNQYNQGYGAVIIMGADNVTFYYVSTINCANTDQKPKGAQFDILSKFASKENRDNLEITLDYCFADTYDQNY